MQADPHVPDLIDIDEVCRVFGGTRPLHPATIYRGIKKGLYPAPIKVSRHASRWSREECLAAISAQAAKRGG